MRYWWVNQNQTYRHEVGGGYLWSPKRKANDQRNAFYESMREVSPGDLVFSFYETRIAAIGIAHSYCYESPKPTEFGTVGDNWSLIGWKIDVSFQEFTNRIRPKDHIESLRGHLSAKYSPLLPNGNGLQSVYLAEISKSFASELFRLIGVEVSQVRDIASQVARTDRLVPGMEPTLLEWESHVEAAIRDDVAIPDTQRIALIQARRGQGLFRSRVQRIENACRITRVDRAEHLVASHTKPWRDSSNEERLNPENGFLLTPTVDHLFDKGFLSFEGNGDLVVSPVADRSSLIKMGIRTDQRINVGTFSEGQKRFLEYHRDNVLRMSQRG